MVMCLVVSGLHELLQARGARRIALECGSIHQSLSAPANEQPPGTLTQQLGDFRHAALSPRFAFNTSYNTTLGSHDLTNDRPIFLGYWNGDTIPKWPQSEPPRLRYRPSSASPRNPPQPSDAHIASKHKDVPSRHSDPGRHHLSDH